MEGVEKLYDSDTDNTTFKDLYKKELVLKLVFLSQIEDMVWARAGISNAKPVKGVLLRPEEYSKAVEKEIERVIETSC